MDLTTQSQPSADINRKWSYTSVPPIRLHDVDRDNFNFSVVTYIYRIKTTSIVSDKQNYVC
jgi:hypothetical protein